MNWEYFGAYFYLPSLIKPRPPPLLSISFPESLCLSTPFSFLDPLSILDLPTPSLSSTSRKPQTLTQLHRRPRQCVRVETPSHQTPKPQPVCTLSQAQEKVATTTDAGGDGDDSEGGSGGRWCWCCDGSREQGRVRWPAGLTRRRTEASKPNRVATVYETLASNSDPNQAI